MEWILPFLALSGANAVMALYATLELMFHGETRLNWTLGFIEFVWIGVCLLALWALPMTPLEAAVPIVFLVGVFSATLSLNRWHSRNGASEVHAVPNWYAWLSLGFSALTGSLACMAIAQHERPESAPAILETSAKLLPWIVGMAALGLAAIMASKRISEFGMRSWKAEVRRGIEAHPECAELFGEVLKLELDLTRTSEQDLEHAFAWRVQGAFASGYLIAEFEDRDDMSNVLQGFVELDDGRVVELTTQGFSI